MRKFILIVASLLSFSVANAQEEDGIKHVVADLTCTSDASSSVIEIESRVEGFKLIVDGKVVAEWSQLFAEDNADGVVMRMAEGGYNITISGEQFASAFKRNAIVTKGTVDARVVEYSNNSKTYSAKCEGNYSFMPFDPDNMRIGI